MADTARTLSALLTLLADNSTKAIAPQHVRDLAVSSMGGYGMIYTVDGSTAQSSIGTSAVKLTGFATNGSAAQCAFGATTDSDITIDVDGVWDVALSCSFSGSGGTTFTLRVRCTGTGTVEGGTIERKLGGGGDTGNSNCTATVTGAVAGDVIDVTIEADGSNKNITMTQGQLRVERTS